MNSNAGSRNKNVPLIIIASCLCGCVVLIIPILAAILLPVFAQSREKARAQVCLSNVKQLSLGVMMYIQDYDEVLPASSSWVEAVSPYTKNQMLLSCPTAVSKSETGATFVYAYAFNKPLSRRSLQTALRPAATPLLYESSSLTKNATDEFTSFPVPGRHMGRDTIGFLDGHAKSMTVEAVEALASANKSSKLFGKPGK